MDRYPKNNIQQIPSKIVLFQQYFFEIKMVIRFILHLMKNSNCTSNYF